MSDVILHRRFVKSCINRNNNKYWYITVYSDGRIETTYGRVGSTSATDPVKGFETAGASQDVAIKKAESLIKTKLRAKSNGEPPYQEVNVVEIVDHNPIFAKGKIDNHSQQSLRDSIISGFQATDPIIVDLLDYLISVNKHKILDSCDLQYNDTTGLFSTPIGVVSKQNIVSARDLLVKLADKRQYNDQEYTQYIEQYLMLIPQKVSHMKYAIDLFSTSDAIQKQSGILDALTSSLDIAEQRLQSTDNTSDNKSDNVVFGTELSVLNDMKEFDRIDKLYNSTKKREHECSRFVLKKVYQLKIQRMYDDYMRNISLGNIIPHLHGSRSENFCSILRSGLMPIPPSSVSITGKMFGICGKPGDGIYLSTCSTKSLGYSTGYWGGGKSERVFMLLNDVIMGNILYPASKSQAIDIDRTKYNSLYVKEGTCGVYNQESVVPVSQINPKYLLEFGA